MLVMVCATLATAAPQVFALSRPVTQPDIFFPKGYDQKKADLMLSVLQDKKFHYLGGLTSFWPAITPTSLAYPTFLDYDGNTASLQEFLTALTRLQGIHIQLTFSRQPTSGSWQVIYSHTAPDTLTVGINLKSTHIDLEKLHLPEWKPGT